MASVVCGGSNEHCSNSMVSGLDIVITGTIDSYMEKKVTPDEVCPYQQLHPG